MGSGGEWRGVLCHPKYLGIVRQVLCPWVLSVPLLPPRGGSGSEGITAPPPGAEGSCLYSFLSHGEFSSAL